MAAVNFFIAYFSSIVRCKTKGAVGAPQGSIFWSKTDIYSPPPPLEIYIFSPKKQRDFRATLPTTK
jgi:hypothetical protein